MRKLYTAAATALLKPYIKRELPGWGLLYSKLIGDYRKDHLWKGQRERWVRGKLHGYEMSVRIDGWSNRATFFLERFYDLPTQLLLKQTLKKGDTFVDVGANEGMMTLLASRLVGESGQVISFEPNPTPRVFLQQALSRNNILNVEVHAAGLSDEAGVLQLFVPYINTGEGSFTGGGNSEGRSISCPVLVGDQALVGQYPRLIKIDVEGFETRVLKGLEGTLRRGRPIIVIEMIARHLARDSTSPKEIVGFLHSLGYEGRKLEMSGRKNFEKRQIPEPWVDGDYVFSPS